MEFLRLTLAAMGREQLLQSRTKYGNDVTEILLKVALNTITLNQTFGKRCFSIMHYDKRKNRTTRDWANLL
jgi:hypothetical protein